MSTSNDPDHFFQTSDSLADSTRKAKKSRNKHGSPIHLPSKILSVIADPSQPDAVYVACSDGTARHLVLETGETTHTYRGPTAPLTSLAFSPSSSSPSPTTSSSKPTLYASCWDKTIWSWDTATTRPLKRFTGHTDFVKCLLYLSLPFPTSPPPDDPDEKRKKPPINSSNSTTDVLISGSADASIIIWDPATSQRLHVLKSSTTGVTPMRGVLCLAVDPSTLHAPSSTSPSTWTENGGAAGERGGGGGKEYGGDGGGGVVIYSTSSDPCIRRWRLSRDLCSSAAEVGADQPPIAVHETSVNSLCFVEEGEVEEEEDAELWTASSDGRAMCLSPRATTTTTTTTKTMKEEEGPRRWEVDTVLEHGDYVRSVCVDEVGGWVVTAGRDEDVKVWDRGTGELEAVLRGHFDEVTGLVVVGGERGGKGRRVVSVGIDRTVRVWSLDQEDLGNVKKRMMEEGCQGEEEEEEDEPEGKGGGGLTEEEEKELAELMDE